MPPVAWIAGAFATGIGVREATGLSLAIVVAAVGAASLLLIFAHWRRRGLGLAAIAQALALGALAAAAAWPSPPDELFADSPWQVVARVEEAPERFAGTARLLVALESVARDGIARTASGRVQVNLGGEPVERLLPGDRVSFRARLRRPRGFVEPASPSPAVRYAARGVIAVCGVGQPSAVVRLADHASDGVRRRIADFRADLLARLAGRLDGERRALVASLVLGDRGEIPPPLDEAFRIAGVTHVLSVSGIHLAIAAGLFFVGLRRLLACIQPLARRCDVRALAAAAALPATVLYTLLTGSQLATIRACVVAWVWLLGALLGRAPHSLAALAAAALLLLGLQPLSLYDPSFQLSFAAALGGVVLVPPLRAVVEPLLPRRPLWRRIAQPIAALLLTSLAATAATAPITAWHFAQVAPAGLVANLIVVPLAELWVLPLGLLGCLALPLSTTVAGPLLDLAGGGAAAMAAIARWFAAVAPRGQLPAPTALEAAVFYAGLLAVAARRPRALLLLGALLAATVAARVVEPRLHPTLRATFFDIGQGDAALVELPGGVRLLIDGGGSFDPGFDPGAQVIAPWLERQGVRRLDVVVLTHPHPDHANGLAAIVERFEVGEIWTNGAPSLLPGLRRLEAAAARRRVPIVRPHPLASAAARVELLHPLQGGVVGVAPGWSENDGSIVLRIDWAGRALLLTGDIEAPAERRLAAAGDAAARLGVDVVKVPHHGSRTSSTPEFVAAVHPRLAVISLGVDNRWRFPAPEVEARWRAAGAEVLRTDRDGAITVTIDAAGRISSAAALRRQPRRRRHAVTPRRNAIHRQRRSPARL